MCNNHAGGESGFDYCTNSPSYTCYDTPNGRPSCCNEPGGSYMNCPQTQPKCDVQPAPKPGPKGGPPPPKAGFESFNFVPTKGGSKGMTPKRTIKGFSPQPDTEIEKLERLPMLKGQQAKKKANKPIRIFKHGQNNYFRSN